MQTPSHTIKIVLAEATTASTSLRHYLDSDELDPYQYEFAISDWAITTGTKVDADATYDNLTPVQQQQFKTWLNTDFDQSQLPPELQAPNTYFTSAALVSPRDWLVHFSNNADDIWYHGFTRGAYDDDLHLTKVTGTSTDTGPWAFAFYAQSRDASAAAQSHKYGNDAVLFQSSAALEAWHNGDEEKQIIFDRTELRPRHLVLLRRLDSENWYVGEESHPYSQGSFDIAVAWAIANYTQYRHVLTRRTTEALTQTVLRQLLETIPGSTDTDVTADEFDTVSVITKYQRAADDLARAISHAFEQKLVVDVVAQIETAADVYAKATGLAAIPDQLLPGMSLASPWGTGYLDKVWANAYRSAFYYSYSFDDKDAATWYTRMLINITRCYAITLRHKYAKAFSNP